MGDPNVPTPQPVHYRPMFGALGGAIASICLTFVSQAALAAGVLQILLAGTTLHAATATRPGARDNIIIGTEFGLYGNVPELRGCRLL